MKPLTLIDKAFLLKKTALFQTLDLDDLLTIADKLEILYTKEEEPIFQIEQEAHHMYLIVEGDVEVLDANSQRLAKLKEGEFFGDEAIFNEKPRSYSAQSISKSVLCMLSRTHLLTIIAECPSVALALLEAYTANLPFRKRSL